MAKILGVFTSMHGKLGGAVMQTWKGVQVIRTHVMPANPQTGGQVTNRTLLTDLVSMFKSVVIPFVRVYWNPFVTARETGWSNLIGLNQGLQSGTVIDYELVQITKGSLPAEELLTATYATGTGVVEATWSDSGAAGSAATDLAMLGVFNKDTNKWYFSIAGVARDDELDSLTMAAGLTITDLTAYIFFFTTNAVSGLVESISDSDAMETTAAP